MTDPHTIAASFGHDLDALDPDVIDAITDKMQAAIDKIIDDERIDIEAMKIDAAYERWRDSQSPDAVIWALNKMGGCHDN